MTQRSRVALLRTTPMRTPLVHFPIFVSEFNHDYLQWSLRFKGIAQRWERTTGWGRLFARYRNEGHLASA